MKLKIHAVAVLILVICTLTLFGLISLAYKKVIPKKPTGKNIEKRKIMAPATPSDATLFF